MQAGSSCRCASVQHCSIQMRSPRDLEQKWSELAPRCSSSAHGAQLDKSGASQAISSSPSIFPGTRSYDAIDFLVDAPLFPELASGNSLTCHTEQSSTRVRGVALVTGEAISRLNASLQKLARPGKATGGATSLVKAM